MKISIHMPAYNAEATIGSALKSLLRQRDAGDLDIVVVDDGSTDRTCDIVGALAARAPEIRLIGIDHGGISKARNAALQAMAPDTDLVGFLDADDLSPEGRHAYDVALFEADPALDLVFSRLRFFDREDPETLAPGASSRILDERTVHLSAGLFRRRVLDRTGLFDETFAQAEDTDYLLRIFEGQPKYLLSDEIGVFYRKHHGGITRKREEAQRDLMRAFFRAHRRSGKPFLPGGIVTITAERLAEVQSWVGSARRPAQVAAAQAFIESTEE
jgi:glycosyltransferase involved in cell wall biosynthesis